VLSKIFPFSYLLLSTAKKLAQMNHGKSLSKQWALNYGTLLAIALGREIQAVSADDRSDLVFIEQGRVGAVFSGLRPRKSKIPQPL
jgi:hypothetical protein